VHLQLVEIHHERVNIIENREDQILKGMICATRPHFIPFTAAEAEAEARKVWERDKPARRACNSLTGSADGGGGSFFKAAWTPVSEVGSESVHAANPE
jgi:hypothetical protein